MAKLIWAVICARVITDAQTNLISYIDTLELVALPSFPIKAPLVVVGSVWEPEGEKKIEVRAKAYSPDNKLLLTGKTASVELNTPFKRVRLANGLAGFDLDRSGNYSFGLELHTSKGWKEIARVPFIVEGPSDPPTQ